MGYRYRAAHDDGVAAAANASTKLSERKRFNSSSSRCGWKSGYQDDLLAHVRLRSWTSFREPDSRILAMRRTEHLLWDASMDLPIIHKRCVGDKGKSPF